MATEYKKISQLPAAESLRGTDQLEIEREGTSKSITASLVKNYTNDGLIDDAHSGSQSTYSSGLIDQKLGLKQDATDNSFATTDKTIIGAINENKSVIGYSYDEYDDTTTSANAYAVDDLCIRNNTLYKCIAPTYGAWDSSKWEQTSIADEIGRIDTELSNKPILLVATANATLAANTITVVSYTFTVPTGYTIVSAYDDSYYAGLVASPIRINSGSGSKVVTFNYFATSGQTHTYMARALALPYVDIRI